MLYYQTVSSGTLELLQQLMKLPELNSFHLVGGTSLALQVGHRISVDLDFFTDKSFDIDELRKILGNTFAPFELRSFSKTGFTCFINQVKCDFFNWSVPFVGADTTEKGIRLCSLKDIAAFKFDAIITRKEKKDFWDIDSLLEKFSFAEMLGFYRQKFPYNDIKIVMDALAEIEIADDSEDPVLIQPREWSAVKKSIHDQWKQFQSEKIDLKEKEKQERFRKAEEILKSKKNN